MYIYIHTYKSIYIYTNLSIDILLWIYLLVSCLPAYLSNYCLIHTRICNYVRLCSFHLIHMCIYIYAYMYIHNVYIYIFMFAYIYTYICIWMCIYIYIYIHTYIYIYIYIYIHIYIYIYTYIYIYYNDPSYFHDPTC